MIAVTENGTRYEFQWDADSSTPDRKYGQVRKNDAEWEDCTMLTEVELGGSMVMAVERGVRRTSRVVEVFG